MTTNEPEYRIERCHACGQDRKGPRIVRMNKEDFEEYKHLETIRGRLSFLPLLAISITSISLFLPPTIGLTPFEGWGLAFWMFCMMISWTSVAGYDFNKSRKLREQTKHLVNVYGVDEKELVEVVGPN